MLSWNSSKTFRTAIIQTAASEFLHIFHTCPAPAALVYQNNGSCQSWKSGFLIVEYDGHAIRYGFVGLADSQ